MMNAIETLVFRKSKLEVYIRSVRSDHAIPMPDRACAVKAMVREVCELEAAIKILNDQWLNNCKANLN